MDLKQQQRVLQDQLREVNQAKAHTDRILRQHLAALPPDKKAEAAKLLSNVRKGTVKIADVMKFAGNISDTDKADLEKRYKDANNIKFTL